MRTVRSRLKVADCCSAPVSSLGSDPLVERHGARSRQAGRRPRPMINAPTDPALQGFRWRDIGPVGQGGRIDDFAVDEKNPSTYYIGFAVSGVWKTMNNGTTFEPIFDTYGTGSIGDLALAPSDPNILYVGTGEANNRQIRVVRQRRVQEHERAAPADR